MSEREMVSADEARAMEHRSDGADEAADVMHMERSALRYVRTVIVLHAIIEGRTVPPTDAELAAHEAAGGSWLLMWQFDGEPRVDTARLLVQVRGYARGHARWMYRWIALDANGSPCAWPEVSRG